MKLTRKMFVLMAITGLMALSPSVRAQTNTAPSGAEAGPRRNGPPSIDTQMSRLDRELKLTDAQKPKVKAVLEARNEKIRALRDDKSLSRDARREKLQSYQKDAAQQLKGILTPEQFNKYEAAAAEARQRMRNGPGGGTNNVHGAHTGGGGDQ
ncbi:MAG: hypothetical protein U1F98_07095 [Verrucomicrobiota bacterium]